MMESEKIAKAIDQIMLVGPDMILIDGFGEMFDFDLALNFHGILPTICFVRNDGWSLGAIRKTEITAYNKFRQDWAGYIRMNKSMVYQPIQYYEHDAQVPRGGYSRSMFGH